MSRLARLLFHLTVMSGLAASAAPARADVLRDALGSWAIGGAANCGLASKFYTLTTYGGNITWRSGTGDVDIETITAGDEREFQTVTINSIHRSGAGYARGTAWTYTRLGPDILQVSVGNGKSFVLGRCF